MSAEKNEPRGQDALLQQRFLDIILSAEEIRDGFDPYPRSLDPALESADEIPAGHIALVGDFPPPNRHLLLLAGKPGSGKTTISQEFIGRILPSQSSELTVGHISIGDTLRGILSGEVNSRHASDVKAYSDELGKAQPLPNHLTASIVKEAVLASDEKLVLLDGYPRFVDQLSEFSSIVRLCGRNLLGLVELTVSDEVVVQRLLGRPLRDGEQKYDKAKIDARIQEYYDSIAATITALIDFSGVKYYEVDATETVESAAKSLGGIVLKSIS